MATYKDSGVDIDAGDRAVELMKLLLLKQLGQKLWVELVVLPVYLMPAN